MDGLSMDKELAKINVGFLQDGIKYLLQEVLDEEYGVYPEEKFIHLLGPEDRPEEILVCFTVSRKDRGGVERHLANEIGKKIEVGINELFDKCFGNIEDDEYSEFGGYYFSSHAIDFMWKITRAISLDNSQMV
jgi:hypothetical protein